MNMTATTTDLVKKLGENELVVEDGTKFKIKLGIGEDAYTSLKLAKTLQSMWDIKGAASAGAVAAASPAIASGFFASTAGPLSFLGLGAAAATPVGWVLGAAVLSGGACYEAMRLVEKYATSRVETIPKFINSQIDLIGATIFDMMAGLSLKISELAGGVSDIERQSVHDYFVEEWGLSSKYVLTAIPLVEQSIAEHRLKDMAKSLADFQMDNSDCNPSAMTKDIQTFLEEIAFSDGDYNEVEELAIEAVNNILTKSLATHNQIARSAKKYARTSSDVAGNIAIGASKAAEAVAGEAKSFVGKIFKK